MSILSNSAIIGLLGAPEAAGGEIERSVRFNSSDSAYCSRVPSLAGDRKKYTFSAWTKRSSLSAQAGVFECSPNSNENTGIYFTSSNELRLQLRVFGSYNLLWTTTAIYRDTAAWYHIVVSVDTGQVSTANAVKIYVNGVEQAATYTAASGSYSQNMNTGINSTSSHHIGYQLDGANYFNGYLADIHFIDGQALDPTSFTEVDATTGQLIPKAYSGTYGTNGFHLPFSDNSTAAALGTDTSGAGNDWTVNNISVTAGAGNDSLVDVPTNGTETDTGVGGEVRGNYCTLNPLSGLPGSRTLSDGNLQITTTTGGSTYGTSLGTIAVSSGKWYFEMTCGTYVTYSDWAFGIASPGFDASAGAGEGDSYVYLGYNGNKKYNGTAASYGATYTTNDVIGCAFDADNGTITFYKNGVSQGQAYSGISGTYTPVVGDTGSGSMVAYLNFGQRPFAYTAPSGFKALCTANLPAPVVTKPSEYMDVALYTGNGGTQTISGLEFSPDLVWIKNRAAADSHKLTDTVRGATEELESDTTAAEATNADGLTQFNSDGFDLGADAEYNTNTEAYVAWSWDAGSSTVSNTDGSITSQVRANPSAGFSIVTWTGNGTVGHGLGVAPVLYIWKRRNLANNWGFNFTFLDGSLDYMYLNLTNAKGNATQAAPTSTVITIPSGDMSGTDTGVLYAFAPVAGYSSFGSYVGNGSSDGVFVYTGMRPKWILIKCSSLGGSGQNWIIVDTARNAGNVGDLLLRPNLSDAEVTYATCDALSNGFKLRNTDNSINSSSQTYIYAAFAESPQKFSRAR